MTDIAQEFLDRVAGALEVPAVTPDTDFRAGPLWDSLTAFALRVMIQQRFGKQLSAKDLASCKTVADLMDAAGVEL
ncbi:MAG: acyl carrier protein [Kiritimatiellae bacterium]|nr:acyl carrier protein [Kiritimatiellia bacterium]